MEENYIVKDDGGLIKAMNYRKHSHFRLRYVVLYFIALYSERSSHLRGELTDL